MTVQKLILPPERKFGRVSVIALASAAAMLFVSGAAEIVDIWPVGSELGEVNDPADKPTLKVMLPPRKDGDMEPIQAVLQPGHES